MAERSKGSVIIICCLVLIFIGLFGIARGLAGSEGFASPLAQASLEILEVDTGFESEEAVEDPACLEESCHTDEIRTGYHTVSAISD